MAGYAVIRRAELERAFADAGCVNVQSVIQSGNVVFDGPTDVGHDGLLEAVRRRLREVNGKEPTVIVRRLAGLAAIATDSPFENITREAEARLDVRFLAGRPRSLPRLPLASPREGWR